MSAIDISRHLNQPQKHYAGGRWQQGRLLTDADANDSALQSAEDLRLSLLGLTGRGFTSSHMSPDEGFSIGAPIDLELDELPQQSDRLGPGDAIAAMLFRLNGESTYVRPVTIRAGTFYVGGMRFELESTEPFALQRDFLQMKAIDIPLRDQGNYEGPFQQLYFLEAWEQAVTATEDHEFLEKALGGADTSGRVRRMRRVRAFTVEGVVSTSCEQMWTELKVFLENPLFERNGTLDRATGEFVPAARLRLSHNPTIDQAGCADCAPPKGTRFLGADNQTLRILCTRSNRFVWALDDSAPLYRVKVPGLGAPDPNAESRVTLLSPLKDRAHAPRVGRVVEIIPFAALLDGPKLAGPVIDPHFNKVADEIGAFSRVVTPYDPATRSFVIASDAPGVAEMRAFVHEWDDRHPGFDQLFAFAEDDPPDERHFYMRFWHEATSNDDIELPAQASPTEPLGNTGYFAHFLADVPGERGNSWTIALRPEGPGRMVPLRFTLPNGAPPDGPRHYFAPLAFLSGDENLVIENSDCRPILRPITDVDCVTFTVGDGKLVKGEFTSIQEAIDTLPDEGGTVLVRPGVYRQQVLIQGRSNITLAGCGAQTVLESIESSVAGIVRVLDSENVRVSGFQLNVATEVGVLVQGSTDVSITNLDAEVGEHLPDGRFGQGNAIVDLAIVRGESATNLALGGLRLNARRRPAIQLEACPGLLVDNVDANGREDVETPAQFPMIELEACHGGVLRDVSFKTFGQLGIVLEQDCRDIEITRVATECGHQFTLSGAFKRSGQTKAALDLEGRRIKVKDARVRMLAGRESTHAAVVLKGEDIEVIGSRIECDTGSSGPAVFGGVQVRGNSRRILIRNNQIIRGIGHGVTLGSVLWNAVGVSAAPRREGPGEDQMPHALNGGHFVVTGSIGTFTDGGQAYAASDEGPLDDISIVGNRIEEFSSNGISSLTVFGLRNNPELEPDHIEMSRLRIEGNRIQSNVRHPSETLFLDAGAEFPYTPVFAANPRAPLVPGTVVLPYGGIVIGHVDQADIRSNLVADNGPSISGSINPVSPVAGIYVANGQSISICKNVVTNNGVRPSVEFRPFRGPRGGIVVLLAGIGVPPDQDALIAHLAAGGNFLQSDGQSVRVSDNVVRQIDGRALHIVATGPVQVDGNFLSSEGFHGSVDTAEDRQAIGDVVFIQNLGGPWERFNVADVTNSPPSGGGRPIFGDYTHPRDAVVYLFNTIPTSPRHFVGLGGQVLFQNNQVVYDWQVIRRPQGSEPLTTFAVAVMSLDHTSISANQFSLRLITASSSPTAGSPPNFVPPPGDPQLGSDEPFVAHVLATGATLEATSNRIAENVDMARFSLLGLGELTFTVTHNQTTHQVWATGANPVLSFGVLEDNQPMLLKRPAAVGDTQWPFHLGVRLFMKLLDRPVEVLGPPPTATPPVV